MKSIIKKILFFLCVGIVFAILILNNNNNSSYNKELPQDKEETELKISWFNNNQAPIYINASATGVGAQNWTWARGQDWCQKGDGSYGNPYIIENVTIDASTSPTGNGILIENSNDENFIIRNCTIYDAVKASVWWNNNGGIKLINSSKGQIYSNDLTSTTGADVWKSGICLYESKDVSIINNTVDGNTYGIFMRNSNESLIFNNSADSNQHVGIFLQANCHNNNITQNSASSNTEFYGIALYYNSDNNNIINNTVNDNGDSGEDCGIRLYSNCNNNTVENNTVEDNFSRGILIQSNSDDNDIINNLVNNTLAGYVQGVGIRVETGCDNNTFIDNTANSHSYFGISLVTDCNDNTISNNTCNNNEVYGIYLYNLCDNNNITGNTANGNGVATDGDGIRLGNNCYGNRIINNTVNDNIAYGIYLNDECGNNFVLNNTANDNDDTGIHLTDSCNDNTIENNTINRNILGIGLYQSNRNNVSENTLKDNGWCIFELGTTDNLIENNDCSGSTKNGPIFINGTATGVGAHNWTWAVSQLWCSGSGTEGAPYIIENLNINGFGITSCIEIINSDKYFIIQDCTLQNSGSGSDDAGIKLENVTHGTLFNNNCSFNYDYGIYLYNDCNYNNITGNTANDNEYYGIYLYDNCDNNTIASNNAYETTGVAYQQDTGIRLVTDCDNNTIVENTVFNNYADGILLHTNCDNNTIQGNIVDHNRDEGIDLWHNCDYNRILGNTVYDNYGGSSEGIQLYGDADGSKPCTYNLISGNNVSYNSNNGIRLYTNCDNNIILNNNASNNGLSGIYLNTGSDDNIIINNTANNNEYRGIFLDDHCYRNNITGNTVGNEGTTNQNDGIYLNNYCDNNIIANNIVNNNTGTGIYLDDHDHFNTIANNTVNDNTGSGINIYEGSNDNIIVNNTVNDNTGNGIYIHFYCYRNNITGNTVNDNTGYGIILYYYLCDNIIANNTVNSNGLDGIRIYSHQSNDNIIVNNIVNDNTRYGIYLESTTNDNTIANNTINRNEIGMYIYGSHRNTISNNTLKDNEVSIYLINSINNTISGNVMNGGGIGLEGNQYTHYSTHKIYTNNTVNGRIVYYYVEENSLKASNFTEAGQVLLINCNNSMISDLTVSQVWCGIFLYNSNYNNITGNTANGNALHGIYLNGCDNNTITGNKNTINYNGICGIFLDDSHWNNITDNIANYNGIYGICLNSSSYNNILYNELIGNQIPFYNDSYCVGNVFEGNIVSRPPSIIPGDDDDDEKEKEPDTTGIVIVIVIIVVGVILGAIAVLCFVKKPVLFKSFAGKLKKTPRRVLQLKKKLGENKLKKTPEKTLESDDIELYDIDTRILDFIVRVFILCVVGLTVTALIVNLFNLIVLAIILSIVAALLLAFTYMIWLLRDLKLSIKLEKLNLKNFGIGILLVSGIYGLVFLILIFGSQIPWFDYYIVNQSEDPYLIYGYTVPNLYLKVTSTIISILAFFLFTMYYDLKKINKDLIKAHKQQKSPSEIYFLKEEFVGKYSSRILFKIMGFILAIGASMIPYTIEGFLIILPIMLMLFVPFSVVILIVILIQKSHVKKSIKYEFILENTKICTSCNKIALFSASYCGKCGKPFESSYRYYESMNKCQNCNSINPRKYKYCIYCGSFITVKTSEAKRKFGKDTIKRVLLRKNRK